jgi:Luciferase
MFQIDKSLASMRDEILDWPGVTARPHEFSGTEFRYRGAQLGGALHIPFTRAIRDELLAQGLAKWHRWSTDSGWISFQIESDEDTRHAIWLMRLSYLRYALKAAENARKMLDRASNEMPLSLPLRSLLSSAAALQTVN